MTDIEEFVVFSPTTETLRTKSRGTRNSSERRRGEEGEEGEEGGGEEGVVEEGGRGGLKRSRWGLVEEEVEVGGRTEGRVLGERGTTLPPPSILSSRTGRTKEWERGRGAEEEVGRVILVEGEKREGGRREEGPEGEEEEGEEEEGWRREESKEARKEELVGMFPRVTRERGEEVEEGVVVEKGVEREVRAEEEEEEGMQVGVGAVVGVAAFVEKERGEEVEAQRGEN